MKGCRVNDGIDAAHALPNEGVICDRADMGGKGRLLEIESDDLVLALLQGPHQALA
jgi:hypothetical protein